MTTRKKWARWTMESFSEHVWHKFNRTIYVIPGQVWQRTNTKLWFYCTTHGRYYAALPQNILRENRGSQCARCDADKVKARQDAITAALVGTTTADGLKVLEHVDYYATAAEKAKGKIGQAVYRYLCPHCGNNQATALGYNLKNPGAITHCGCLGKRDSVQKFQRNPKHRDANCNLYIFETIAGTGLKVGITNNLKTRPTESYGDQVYNVQLTRANAWAIEQCIHYLLRSIGFQYDLEDVPAWTTINEGGGSEVFNKVSLTWLIEKVQGLIAEVDAIGFDQLIDRYIPVQDQNKFLSTRWDDNRLYQISKDNTACIGFNFEQTFRDMFDGKITNN